MNNSSSCCDKDIHNYFISEGYIQCVFCDEIITEKYVPLINDNYCCNYQKLNTNNTCTNCGTVYPQYVNEYIDFNENKYKIKTKSVYLKKIPYK